MSSAPDSTIGRFMSTGRSGVHCPELRAERSFGAKLLRRRFGPLSRQLLRGPTGIPRWLGTRCSTTVWKLLCPPDDLDVQILRVEMGLQIEWVERRGAWVVERSAGVLFPGGSWLCCLDLDGLVPQQLSADGGGDIGSIDGGVRLCAACCCTR